MSVWELRERVAVDERLRSVLKVIRDSPGMSTRRLCAAVDAADKTVKRKIAALETMKLVQVRGKKEKSCGTANRHFITRLGLQVLKDVEKIPNPAAFVQLVYSDGFLDKLGVKDAKKFQKAFGNPAIRNSVSILISKLVKILFLKEAGCACTFLDEYDQRLYFIGDLSDKDSDVIRQLVTEHVFSEEAAAMKYVIVVGMKLLRDVRKQIERNAEAFFSGKSIIPSLVTFRYDPEKKQLQTAKCGFRKISEKKFLLELP